MKPLNLLYFYDVIRRKKKTSNKKEFLVEKTKSIHWNYFQRHNESSVIAGEYSDFE